MSTTWDIPKKGLTSKGREAAVAILDFLIEKGSTEHGGGGRFYTPSEWRDRGEAYGTASLLIVVHDGGDHAPAFNYDYEDYVLMEEMRERLATIGVYSEQCTSWYSAIYPTGGTE